MAGQHDTVTPYHNTCQGLALIIVNQNFTSLKKREGAHEDFRVLTETFRELGFKIIALFDMTDTEILAVIKTVSAMDHSSYANFVMVVSSHGNRHTKFKRQPNKHLQDLSKNMKCDYILGVNEKAVDFFTLTSHFMEDKCPTLKGKPKLFFIQACRGKWVCQEATADENTTVATVGPRPLLPPPQPPSGPRPPPSLHFRGPAAEDIPIWRDCLLACSTPPGYKAVHNSTQGSWFIRELCDVLLEQHEWCDLLRMLTEVNWRVTTKNSEKPERNGLRAMPWIASMLKTPVWL